MKKKGNLDCETSTDFCRDSEDWSLIEIMLAELSGGSLVNLSDCKVENRDVSAAFDAIAIENSKLPFEFSDAINRQNTL